MVGYKGTDCKDRDWNKPDDPVCPSLGQCKNGGTCWNKTCCCVEGYDGVLCQNDIIECLSSPCVNGGTCKDEVGAYRCECPEGRFFTLYSVCTIYYTGLFIMYYFAGFLLHVKHLKCTLNDAHVF